MQAVDGKSRNGDVADMSQAARMWFKTALHREGEKMKEKNEKRRKMVVHFVNDQIISPQELHNLLRELLRYWAPDQQYWSFLRSMFSKPFL